MRFNFLFFIFIVMSSISNGQSLNDAQYYINHSNYKVAISKFQQIRKKATTENKVVTTVLATNGLADCYTDLGAYYKSNVLLFENLTQLYLCHDRPFEPNKDCNQIFLQTVCAQGRPHLG